MSGAIHVLVGPPCAGKSALAWSSAGVDDLIIDYDKIAEALGGGGHMATGPVAQAAVKARSAVVAYALDGIPADTWLIHASPSQAQIERYKQSGATFHYVDPGIQTCLDRCSDDGRPAGTIEQIHKWYESPPIIEMKSYGGAMKYKEVPFTFETKGDDLGEGEFLGYASTFSDKPDSYGDVVREGAFTRTLAEQAASKSVLSVLYAHDFSDPFNNIGVVLKAEEDKHGLQVRGKIDMENPTAAQVYRLMKDGRLSKMSFAYTIVDGGFAKSDGEEVYEIRDVDLHEVSIVPIPANNEAVVTSVKTSGNVFTDEEVVVLKKMMKEFSSQVGEVAGKSVKMGEAALRVKEIMAELNESVTE